MTDPTPPPRQGPAHYRPLTFAFGPGSRYHAGVRVINQSTETVALDALRPHPRNPRQGNIGAIHDSITANGFYGQVVAQKSTGFILAGNHRWRAAAQPAAPKLSELKGGSR